MHVNRFLQALLAASLATSAAADSTVVFNEIMYHPQTNEAVLEWVELYNQQAVDMDISGWSIANGIHFDFAEGTVIPGGGYLLIASSPGTLRTAAGMTNVLGPFTGRLSNAGDKLELLNNNQRVVDSVSYGVEGDWPAGPDGSGVSLAKIEPDLASAPAENWRMSAQVGGTPGRPNFPGKIAAVSATTLVGLAQTWKYNQSGTDLGTAWRQPGYSDSAWPSGPGLLGHETALLPAPIQTELALGPSTYYFRTHFNFAGNPQQAALSLRHVLDDSMIVYLNGLEVYRIGLAAGPITYTNLANRSVSDAVSEGPFIIPSGRLLEGDNVLAVEVHQNSLASSDVVFGLELASSTTSSEDDSTPSGDAPSLAFNEVASSTNSNFWLELINVSGASVPLAGHVIARFGGGVYREAVLPDETLPPGALLQVPRSTLGFSADSGDLLVLYAPGRTNVLDAVVARKTPRARSPDGAGQWLFPARPTPGASNEFLFHPEIVINEIMYHPRQRSSSGGMSPGADPPESWVELYNRGSNTVELTGWRLDKGIDYRFVAGTTISPAAYLVIAQDPAYLRSLYPGIEIVGPFTNRLSGQSDHLVLKDANNNPADEVRYFNRGRWPVYADGGGSSLELRDPTADNSKAEAWAASIEAPKSSWSNYTYRGVATATPGPTYWNEFVLGLLDAGECLVDDIHVIESPASSRIELLQNGSFEKGTAAWRFLGTHKESRVIADPDNPANHLLHLIATGPTEHMHNHLETTFAGNRALVNGREYEISFRAKWLAGANLLNTRCYFNRLSRTTPLPVPRLSGTPGARNSTFTANIGPTFARFGHSPVVPQPNQAVKVSVAASDAQGVSSCVLWWSTDGSSWSSAAMSSSNGLYRGTIPGFSPATIVQFYVQATDGLGASSTYPARGPGSRALYIVNDGQASLGKLHNLRIIMTRSDADWLHALTNVMSNAKLGATVLYDENEVFYDVGVKLQGSEHGRFEDNRVGFTIDFDPDHLFRGGEENVTIDRSSFNFQGGGPHEEILVKQMVNHAGGLPGMYDDLVRIIAPRAAHTGTGLMLMAKYGKGFLDSQYENGSDGMLFKMELVYPLSATLDGNPESQKVPQAADVIGTDLTDLGSDKELYRHFFLIENHRDRDDYSGMISLAKALNLTGATLESQTRLRLDPNEWMRAFAFEALIGVSDTFSYDNPHNFMIYFRPADGRALAFLWDMDFCFNRAVSEPFPGAASRNMNKLFALPANRRAYFGHLNDLITTTYNRTYAARWTTHYGALLGQNWGGILNYIASRANFVQSRLPLAVPFKITVSGPNDFNTGTNLITLHGTSPIQAKDIEVNSVNYPVTWNSITNWTITVPLAGRSNVLTFRGRDYGGHLLSNALEVVTVVNTNAVAPAPPRLIEALVAAGVVTLRWEAVPGQVYNIEFKDDLSDELWIPLGEAVQATETTASGTDDIGAIGHRFYRIRLVN